MKLSGKKIYIQLLNVHNLGNGYMDWMNNPLVTRHLESRWTSYDKESLEGYVRSMNNSPNDYLFGIFDIQESKHIGNIKIGSIHPVHRYAYLGLIIGDETYWGRGIASEAIKLAVNYSFKHLNLNKLVAGMYESNVVSVKTFQKNGFQRVGHYKKHVFSEGKYLDMFTMELLKSDNE